MSKFCHNCGAQLKETSKFCMKCGTPVIGTEPARQIQQPQQYQQPLQEQQYQQPVKHPQQAQGYRYAVPNQDKQNGYPQQQYPQQSHAAQPQYPPQYQPQVKKKSPALRIIAVVLIVAILAGVGVTGFVYPGFFRKPSGDIIQCEVILPKMSAQEGVTQGITELTLSYYLAANAAFDKACNIDPETATDEEIKEGEALIEQSIRYFETAERLSELLEESAETLMKSDQSAAQPEITVKRIGAVNTTLYTNKFGGLNAVAPVKAGISPELDSLSEREWAEAITYLYDTESGHSYKRLGEMFGKSAKYMQAAVSQASAIIEREGYLNVADKYTNAIKAAKVARAAGAVAGASLGGALVVAAGTGAVTAGGAVTAASVCKGVITVGGAVVSGANAAIDCADAAVSIAVGDENNEMIDTIEGFRTNFNNEPVVKVFKYGKLAYGAVGLMKDFDKLFQNNFDLNTLSYDTDVLLTKTYLVGSGLLNFMNSNPGLANAMICINVGSNENGQTKITVTSTKAGTDDKSKENIQKVIEMSDINEETKEAFETALEDDSITPATFGDDNGADADADANDEYVPLPDEVCDSYISEIEELESQFDIDEYIDKLAKFLIELALMDDPTEEETEEETEEPTEAPTIAPTVDPRSDPFTINGDWTCDGHNFSFIVTESTIQNPGHKAFQYSFSDGVMTVPGASKVGDFEYTLVIKIIDEDHITLNYGFKGEKDKYCTRVD